MEVPSVGMGISGRHLSLRYPEQGVDRPLRGHIDRSVVEKLRLCPVWPNTAHAGHADLAFDFCRCKSSLNP